MKKVKFLNYGLAMAAALSIGLSGCGGGGGGSSSTGPVFPSDSVLAEPTLVNAQKVRDVVIGDPLDNLPDVPLLNSVNSSSEMNLELLSRNVSQMIIEDAKSNTETYSLNAVDEFTQDCLVSGTIDIYANGDEINGGYITMTYNDCNDGDDLLLNGSVKMTLSNLDTTAGEFKDMTITFTTDLTLTDLSQTLIAKIVQGSYMTMNILAFDMYGVPTDFKVSMSMQATDGVEIHGVENVVYYYEVDTMGTTIVIVQTQGKMYIDNLAQYVEYDTTYDMAAQNTPFIYIDGIIQSGEARYIMADGAKMKIVITGGLIVTYVDADGDGVYEISDEPL